jgi:hypothetical protein
LRAVDHGARGTDLGLSDGAAHFDIDDDCVIEINQVVGGIGEEGVTLQGASPLRCRIGP